MTNFLTLLKQEHQEARETFERLLGAEEIDRQEVDVLCEKLALHMEMEESYFYPAMAKFKKEAGELAEEAQLEHDEAKKVIKSLRSGKLEEVEYKVKLEMLQLEIGHHADEEEQELFPLAKQKLSEAQMKEITEKMMALKEKRQEVGTKR